MEPIGNNRYQREIALGFAVQFVGAKPMFSTLNVIAIAQEFFDWLTYKE
jgi:hypothetical protein